MFRKTLMAAAAALLVSAGANAATVDSTGVTGGCASTITDVTVGQIDVLAGAQWDASFTSSDSAGYCSFDLNNTSLTDAVVTVAVATVNQALDLWGFKGGVQMRSNYAELDWSVGEGSYATKFWSFVLPAKAIAIFDWNWGTPYSTGNEGPNIDFSVSATPVPVPVPGTVGLLGLGLMGLGLIRRKAS